MGPRCEICAYEKVCEVFALHEGLDACWYLDRFEPRRDVAPVVHAKWETRMIDGQEKACCSGCGRPNKQYRPPYCPHCGAKMDKED